MLTTYGKNILLKNGLNKNYRINGKKVVKFGEDSDDPCRVNGLLRFDHIRVYRHSNQDIQVCHSLGGEDLFKYYLHNEFNNLDIEYGKSWMKFQLHMISD